MPNMILLWSYFRTTMVTSCRFALILTLGAFTLFLLPEKAPSERLGGKWYVHMPREPHKKIYPSSGQYPSSGRVLGTRIIKDHRPNSRLNRTSLASLSRNENFSPNSPKFPLSKAKSDLISMLIILLIP